MNRTVKRMGATSAMEAGAMRAEAMDPVAATGQQGIPIASGTAASSSGGSFMKRNAGEYILVLLSAWAVGTTALNAFYLDELAATIGWWGRAFLSLVVVAVLTAVLYWATARRNSGRGGLAGGTAVYIVLVAVVVAVSLALSNGGESIYQDAEGNYMYMAVVLVASATACFLLTRTLAGSAVWFVAAAFTCSVVQALYEPGELALGIVATFTSLALIVHRNFRLGLGQARVANPPSHGGVFATSVAVVGVVVACAAALWFGVIAPMEPGTLDIKLITDYRSLPIDEYKGTADENPQLSFEYTSDNLTDGTSFTTDDLVRDPTSSTVIDATSLLMQQMAQMLEGLTEDGGSSGGGEEDALDEDSLDAEYNALSYTWFITNAWLVTLLVILLIALVVGYFVGRRILRQRRLRKLLELEPAEQVEGIYRFLLSRLKRLGFEPAAGVTLTQWARQSAHEMEVLDEVARVPFESLTSVYIECVYGGYEPTEDDVVPFAVYYMNFWRAARAHLGTLKYFFKSFRL